jgi:hypothetical protein
LLQIFVKNLKHGYMPDAGVIEFLKGEARNGKFGEQYLACGIPQLASPAAVLCEFITGTEQRPRGAEACGIGMVRFDGSTVARERSVPLRSAGFVVNELTGADDDLVDEGVCHSRGLMPRNRGVYEKKTARWESKVPFPYGCGWAD